MGSTDGERQGDDVLWNVECHLALDVVESATVVLQILPATTAGTVVEERFSATVDGSPVDVVRLDGDHGGIVHVLEPWGGSLNIDLAMTLDRALPTAPTGSGAIDNEQLTYLRQSRYCPSDRLRPFALGELGHLPPGPELLNAVGDWVSRRLVYEEGFSGPLDSAVDSLFAGRGVCRDFAHLAITMLRALGVPARLVAVYAPGLSPMDFHAVTEAYVEGQWRILDATRLAPRTSLVRVCTGRDAADTAFLSVLDGEATLRSSEVVAYTDGLLPNDDHLSLVSLA